MEASVFESLDSDANDISDLKAGIWVGNNDRSYTSWNPASIRPSAKGVWETVSGIITIWKPNVDEWPAWDSGLTYNAGDVVRYDGGTNGSIHMYRCLNDETSGLGTEPSNVSYWVRADDSQIANFGIFSENCTTGFFLVDDIVLFKIEPATAGAEAGPGKTNSGYPLSSVLR